MPCLQCTHTQLSDVQGWLRLLKLDLEDSELGIATESVTSTAGPQLDDGANRNLNPKSMITARLTEMNSDIYTITTILLLVPASGDFGHQDHRVGLTFAEILVTATEYRLRKAYGAVFR